MDNGRTAVAQEEVRDAVVLDGVLRIAQASHVGEYLGELDAEDPARQVDRVIAVGEPAAAGCCRRVGPV